MKQKPTVTYRKNKSLSEHLFKSDIANKQLHSNVTPCGKFKSSPQINTAKLITNDKLNITEKIKVTGNCKEREIIHAAQCSKHKVLDIGHSPNIAMASKTGQTTANLQNIFTTAII